MKSPASHAVLNEFEKAEQLTNRAHSVISRTRDLSTFTGGYRNDWRAYFSAAVRKTLRRRKMVLKAQYQRRYAGILSTMLVLIGFCMLTATVGSAATITVTGT